MNLPPMVKAFLLLEAMIVLHEASHAWVAAALKMRIKKIVIGISVFPTWTWHIAGIPVVISPWLVWGGVFIDDDDFWNAPFWKKALVSAYGPMGNIIGAMMVTFVALGPAQGLPILQETAVATVQAVGMLLTGRIALTELNGPIEVIAFSAQAVAADDTLGLLFVWLIVNFSIAVINLVPIPALDGGHILIGLLCSIARDKPRALSFAKSTTSVFVYALLFGVILLTLRDALRYLF